MDNLHEIFIAAKKAYKDAHKDAARTAIKISFAEKDAQIAWLQKEVDRLKNEISALTTQGNDFKNLSREAITAGLELLDDINIMRIVNGMCEESLPPDLFDKWVEVRTELFMNRKDLKKYTEKVIEK